MRLTHKIKVAFVATVATVAVAGAAFAYFTTTGTGTGAGTVGTSSVVTINGTAATLLYPGTSSPVTFTVDNPSPGAQWVQTITLASVTAPVGCIVADFTMTPVTAAQQVASGLARPITATGTLVMANTAIPQDACKAAALVLTFTSN